MESTLKELPDKILNDEEYEAFDDELRAMHNAFAANDMAHYDDDRFRAIVVLMQAYRPPSKVIDAVDVVTAYMDLHKLKQVDLVPYFGSRAKVSEFLNRKRPLSLLQMRKLHQSLGISWDDLAN